MSEHIIENCTKEEIDRLEQSNLNWYPDDLMTSDVCICGTRDDAERALEIIGRKTKIPEQKPTAHWIFTDEAHEHARCSKCGYGDVDLMDGKPHNYCQSCGAKIQVMQE